MAVGKRNYIFSTAASAVHMQDGSMHHRDKSCVIADKKIVQKSSENNSDSIALTKPLRDGPTIGTRQSLSSKPKQQKHGHLSLMDSPMDDARVQWTDNEPSTVKENVTVSQTVVIRK